MRSTIRIAGIQKLSLNNGYGCRIVVFVQGCDHRCFNCQNPDTWDPNGGTEIRISDLAELIQRELNKHPLDGVTLSGGDPFYQEEECAELLRILGTHVDVWCYTGYEYNEIKDSPLSRLCDFLVCGPYIDEKKCEGRLYGSSNQYIVRRKKNEN